MTAYDIIYRKRNGNLLSKEEITFFLTDYLSGKIPDYQMSAMLMALFFYPMTDSERMTFTSVMLNSGSTLTFENISSPKIDKHSTGGVGDGVSISLAPLVASCGIVVPMMSGRGLGHTGGTLDKLESIPGFKVRLSEKKIHKTLEKTGLCLFGQTENLVPLDKRLYALRDVTATVDNIDLISASIMSKKMAEGIDGLVLDVKCGRGAFMKNAKDAEKLARTMINIGKSFGKKISALITNMDEPLGKAIGNSLEVIEQIELLKGRGSPDMTELVFALGTEMLILGGKARTVAEAQKKLNDAISTGAALEKFKEIIIAQSGTAKVIDNYKAFPQAKFSREITSPSSGFVAGIDPMSVGRAAILLGAGRKKTSDRVDPAAGFKLLKKKGDAVSAGEAVAVAYANDRRMIEEGIALFSRSLTISSHKPGQDKLIIKKIPAKI